MLVPGWLPGEELGNLWGQMLNLKKLKVAYTHLLWPF